MSELLKLYHVSPKYHGKRPIFTPRIPESAAEGEIPTPRICVCPSVWQCYVAMQFDWAWALFKDRGDYHVYEVETANSVKAHKSVIDRQRTQERWLLEPTILTHVLKMPKIKPDYRVKSWHSPAYEQRILCDIIHGTFAWALDEKRWREERRAEMQRPLVLEMA